MATSSVLLLTFSLLNTPTFVESVIASEPHISEIEYNAKYRAFLEDIRYKNEELPLECRKDFCAAGETVNRRKGTFQWKVTLIGQRYHAPCPFGAINDKGTGEKHGVRDCVLIRDKPIWRPPNYDGCRDPPTARRLKQLGAKLVTVKRRNDLAKTLTFLQGALQEIIYLYGNYTYVPVLEEDIIYGGLLLEEYTKCTEAVNHSISVASSRDIAGVANRILGAPIQSISMSNFKGIQVICALIRLAKLVDIRQQSPVNISMKHMSMQVKRIKEGQTLHMSDTFRKEEDNSTVLYADLPAAEPLQATFLILYNVDKFMRRTSLVELKPIENNRFTTAQPSLQGVTPRRPLKSKYVMRPRNYERFKGDAVYFHVKYGNYSKVTQIAVNITASTARKFKKNVTCGILTNPLQKLRTGKQSTWYVSNGIHKNGLSVCQYESTGMYGRFTEMTFTRVLPPFRTIIRKSPLSVLLRFPYSAELYVTGHVLRTLSLLCLILTVLSHVVFRRAKKSRPTLILVNLCLSLIALLIILSVTEFFAGDHAGCRWANGLRLYFILASLMWNGTEAINMYLLLIKVLNSHISKFMWKAAVVCWGIPAIISVVPVPISHSAFDGEYVNCTFQCRLRENTLYYAFLLPMSIIIAHNIIIFTMVVRRLLIGGAEMASDQKRSKFIQLAGSVALLVLLGVPWVFSVFGTIEANNGKNLALLEGIFNVVFVVFVNIQGVFIFLFHCVRMKDIRNSWRTALTSFVSTSSTGTRRTTSTSAPLSDRSQKCFTEPVVGKTPAAPHKNGSSINTTL